MHTNLAPTVLADANFTDAITDFQTHYSALYTLLGTVVIGLTLAFLVKSIYQVAFENQGGAQKIVKNFFVLVFVIAVYFNLAIIDSLLTIPQKLFEAIGKALGAG